MANPARTASTSSVSVPPPEEGLHRREGHRRVVGLVRAEAAGGTRRRTPRRAPAASSSWPPTATSRRSTPNSTPSRAGPAPHLAARGSQQHLGRLGGLLGQDRDRARLDDPRLLRWRSALDGVAEQLGVVQVDRRHDRDDAVGHVRGVPGAAHADLDDPRRRPGRRRRSANASAVSTSKYDIGGPPVDLAAGVDQLQVRREVVVGRDEPLDVDRLAVERIRSRTSVRCGLV